MQKGLTIVAVISFLSLFGFLIYIAQAGYEPWKGICAFIAFGVGCITLWASRLAG